MTGKRKKKRNEKKNGSMKMKKTYRNFVFSFLLFVFRIYFLKVVSSDFIFLNNVSSVYCHFIILDNIQKLIFIIINY